MPRLLTRNRTWILAVCALALIVSLFSFPIISSGVKSFTVSVLSFPARLLAGIGKYFKSKNHLQEENAELRKEAGDLALRLQQYGDLRAENERLRALLDFKERIKFDTVSAEIIARNPADWTGSFTVDKGSADGVKRNSSVCSAEGLLGKVVDVRKNTSSVMLLRHPSFKTGGMLRDTRVNGVVVGAGKEGARMLYIPVDAEVAAGETVITSGLSRISPKGIVIGKVKSVDKSKTGLFKYAVIEPAADPFDQEEVLCIK